MVVNAGGAWVDEVRRLEDPASRPATRLSKGVHLTLPLPSEWKAAVCVDVGGSRFAFALPWEGVLLLGTTDSPYEGDPAQVSVGEADIDQVLVEASISLPPEVLRRDTILYSFAGLRVLQLSNTSTAETPREHVITKGPLGMVSVAGGKLTTHRRIAMDVLRHLDDARAQQHKLIDKPLPGGGPLPERSTGIDPEVWGHLVRHYGSQVTQLLEYRESVPDSFERIHPAGPDVWAQVHHAVTAEWARTVEDVVRRRTTLAVRGLATEEVRTRIASITDARGHGHERHVPQSRPLAG